MSDSITGGIKTVLHPVADMVAAKAVYTAMLDVCGGRLVATFTDTDG